ncbi:MAG: UDP-N-acetylmuramoyl-L-alanine--D-glutamate ligase [Gammaproteobacteria bacterium]|nr:UDP-N-acetylmuramoyl-L-alanine--D-glutamate ligase [Gammaproteobacteria bacterium]
MAEAALTIEYLAKPTVMVLGTGLTGASCARYFAARNVLAMFVDSRELPPGLAAVKAAMPDASMQLGSLPVAVPSGIKTIVVSPGFQPPAALLADARSTGVPVVSDIDLFLAEEAGSVLLVTGSNGKSTVTSLVNHLFCAAGIESVAGGNLGIPALDLLGEVHDMVVLELSSFQLERSELPHSKVATILNLAIDHIDQHGSFEAYRSAKQRIYKHCEIAVINRAEPDLTLDAATQQISFGLDKPLAGQWGVDAGQIMCGDQVVMPVVDVPLAGQHNLQNVLAAFAMTYACGVSSDALVAGVASFKALPHRMQLVPTNDGVTWINDSKATNDAAAAASISSIVSPLILIAGGDGKGSTFELLADAMAKRDAQALVFGKDAAILKTTLAPVCSVMRVESLTEAVAIASVDASEGSTVLLAPACGSLDMFVDFAERGERFVELVMQLETEETVV